MDRALVSTEIYRICALSFAASASIAPACWTTGDAAVPLALVAAVNALAMGRDMPTTVDKPDAVGVTLIVPATVTVDPTRE